MVQTLLVKNTVNKESEFSITILATFPCNDWIYIDAKPWTLHKW